MSTEHDRDSFPEGGLDEKLERLRVILREMGSVLVAFSGGCDSAFLLKAAFDALKENAVALTASSPTHPPGELEDAETLAREIGAWHVIVTSGELGLPEFRSNPPRRCYHCKMELFRLCLSEAQRRSLAHVADATNTDDLKDYRPGLDAARQLGVRSPLAEAGFSKAEIREASKRLGLRTWAKPSMACLASRFPYGTPITEKELERIAACEQFLRSLGFSIIRVRHHGTLARIEVGEEEIPMLLSPGIRGRVAAGFREAGYLYVAVDLKGYRTGSMNEALPDRS